MATEQSAMARLGEILYEPQLRQLPEYGKLFFDHLCAEYAEIISADTSAEEKEEIKRLAHKRLTDGLTWKDIYLFEQTLVKYLKPERLKRKIKTLRNQYREIAGQKEFDVYLAAKPPDLDTTTDETRLQQDCQFLLNEFYLRYALLSAREHMRNNLLKVIALLAVSTLVVGCVFAYLNLRQLTAEPRDWRYGVTTLAVVMFAGIVGAFLSMQQRIQAAPTGGDPLYNFSMLTHGRFGIFLSPISGAVFSIILYAMFTGGVISGKIFPEITTIKPPPKPEAVASPAASPQQAEGAPVLKATPTATPIPNDPVLLNRFLADTGPVSGVDYALLVIWAFIAGFAERFVPDALNRLIAKSDAERAQ